MKPNVTISNAPSTDKVGPTVFVSFGSITIEAPPPPEHVRRANIEAGQAALRRAKSTLIKVGIKLPREKGVPLYFGCENRPGLMIQELDGKRTLGKFVRGCFRVVKQPGTSAPKARQT